MTESGGTTDLEGVSGVDDATVARPRTSREEAVDDATILRPRPRDPGEADDATAVRPQPQDDELEAADPEATLMRPRRESRTAPASGSGSAGITGSVAMPVEEPEVSGRSFGTESAPGLDPERRIAAVPDRLPWETRPAAERGVRPGAPVVYGARSEHLGTPLAGVDEVHRQLGDPPPATFIPVREGRSTLPSMTRRAARARVGTLVGYGIVVIVAVAGLWGVAVLAFG